MILVLIEHDRGEISKVSLQTVSAGLALAEQIGTTLEAVLIGADSIHLKDDLSVAGVTTVRHVVHERLTDYVPEAWAQSLVQLINSLSPELVLAPGTDRGHEVLAHAGARLNVSIAANCIEIKPGEPFEMTRIRWGGSLLEESTLSGETKLISIAPHVFEVTEQASSGM